MRLFLLALTVLISLAPQSYSKSLIWKTETKFAKKLALSGECKPDDEGCLEADHVAYASVSHYGPKYYLTYEEAVRAYVSFDATLDNNRQVQTIFAVDQIAPGAFDWGGIIEGGKFKPLYVVKRFYDPGFDYSTDKVNKSKTGLYVWRLSPATGKGNSDMIGMAGAQIEKARALAENDFSLRHKKLN